MGTYAAIFLLFRLDGVDGQIRLVCARLCFHQYSICHSHLHFVFMSMCRQEELLEMMNENQDKIQQKEDEVEGVKLTLKSLQVKLLKVEGVGGTKLAQGLGPRPTSTLTLEMSISANMVSLLSQHLICSFLGYWQWQ